MPHASRILPFVLAGFTLIPAKVHRIGLFLGMDRGLASEPPLKFAARDARQMAELFRQSGLYQKHELFEVTNKPLERVRRTMAEVEEAAKAKRAEGDQTHLFVYFSGHGDAQSLHVHGGKLDRQDLIGWMNDIPVDLKILVLDACESGNFLRAKGARFVDAKPMRAEREAKNRGSVIITSTSRGELAQESDEYQGAVFTHHLLNGLRGLANYNGDAWIGLEEAFEYSRRATHMDMALGGDLKQTPSFDLDMVGGQDPSLLPVDRGQSRVLLRNFPAGNLEILDAHSLTTRSKVWLSGSDSLGFSLAAGSYLFRFEEGGKDWLHTATFGKDATPTLDRKAFKPKVNWAWTSKGAGHRVKLAGFQPSIGFPHPFPRIPMRMGRLDHVTRTAAGKTSLGLGMATGSLADEGTGLASDFRVYRGSAAHVRYLAGNRRLRLYAGGLAAYNLVRQETTDSRFGGREVQAANGPVPAVIVDWAPLYQVGAPFELEWAVWGRFWVSAEAVYSLYAFEDAGRGRYRARLELEPFLGLGMSF